MVTSYLITNNKLILILKVTATINNPNNVPLTLEFNRRVGTLNIFQRFTATLDSATHTIHTFTIPLKNYNVGDTLNGFRLRWMGSGSASYKDLGAIDGVTFLVDGEEMSTEKSNTYTTKWDNVGEHTIQAVYRGNDTYTMAVSPKKTFYVHQDDSGSGGQSSIYKLDFIDLNQDTFKYKDGSTVTVKLTRGGTPLGGETITLSSSKGYTTTAKTLSDGTAKLRLGELAVGKHTLNAVYEDDGEIQCSSQRTINIIKNKAHITYEHNDDKDYFNKGDWIIIHWQEPITYDGKHLNDRNLPVYINGRMYLCQTQSSGRTWIQFNNSGTYRFKAVYNGDDNLEYTEYEFTITAR